MKAKMQGKHVEYREQYNPVQHKNSPRIFYDGSCGLCHGFVKFALVRMEKERPFIFSPIGGRAFTACVSGKEPIPDSVIVYDVQKQRVLYKGEAVIYILKYLGKIWKCLGYILQALPTCIVNFGYDIVAKIRYKIFKKPDTVCPIIPKELKIYFEE